MGKGFPYLEKLRASCELVHAHFQAVGLEDSSETVCHMWPKMKTIKKKLFNCTFLLQISPKNE